MNRLTFKSPLAEARIKRMLYALRSPLSIAEISESLHMSQTMARYYMRHLHKEGMAHITCYKLKDSTYVAHYLKGAGIDAEICKIPRKEARKRTYARLVADADRYDRHLSRKRAMDRISRGVKHDPLMSAFFGAAIN